MFRPTFVFCSLALLPFAPTVAASAQPIDRVQCFVSRTSLDGKVLERTEVASIDGIGFKTHVADIGLVARVDARWEDANGNVVVDNPSIQFEIWPDKGGPVTIKNAKFSEMADGQPRGFESIAALNEKISWLCSLKVGGAR